MAAYKYDTHNRERTRTQKLIEEYQARGGMITKCGMGDGAETKSYPRLTRAQKRNKK